MRILLVIQHVGGNALWWKMNAAGSVGHPYAKLATVFWEECTESGDVGLACEKAVEYAADYPYEILTDLGRAFYGYGQREYASEDVCPFE